MVAGVAVHHHLEMSRAVIVGEQPDGHQDVLEGLAAVIALDLQVAMRVAGDLGGAKAFGLGVHFLARGLGGGDEVNLIAFHHPAGKVGGVVGGQFLRRKRLDAAQHFGMDAAGGRLQFVLEKMVHGAGAGHPADFLYLTCLDAAVGVAKGFGLVVVIAAEGGPVGVDLGVEGPVGNVKALGGVGQGGVFEAVGGEPAAGIPGANGVAHLAFGELHGQKAFRAEGGLDFLVGNEGGGAAEIAALADMRGVEDGNGLATLAFDGDFFRLPAALVIGNAAQGGDQIMFDDDLLAGGVDFGLGGRDGAAERAEDRLLGGVPLRFAAAGGAGEFLLGSGVGHGELRIADCGLRILNRRQRRGKVSSFVIFVCFCSLCFMRIADWGLREAWV